jgi:hypothetical protein
LTSATVQSATTSKSPTPQAALTYKSFLADASIESTINDTERPESVVPPATNLETSSLHDFKDEVVQTPTDSPVIAFSPSKEREAPPTLSSDLTLQVQRTDDEPLFSNTDVELPDPHVSENSSRSTRRLENRDGILRLQITSYRPRRHFFEHLLDASE